MKFIRPREYKTKHPRWKEANDKLPYDFPDSLGEMNSENIHDMRSGFAKCCCKKTMSFVPSSLHKNGMSARLVQDFKDSFEKEP